MNWYTKEKQITKERIEDELLFWEQLIEEERKDEKELPPNWKGWEGNRTIADGLYILAIGNIYKGTKLNCISKFFEEATRAMIANQEINGYNKHDATDTIIYAILSRNRSLYRELITKFSNVPIKTKENENEYNYFYYYFPVLFNIIKENMDIKELKRHLEIFIQKESELTKDDIIFKVGTGSALEDILDKDVKSFLDHIEKRIIFENRSYKKNRMLPISKEATYLIFLARDKGLDISCEMLKERFPEKYHIFIKQALIMD